MEEIKNEPLVLTFDIGTQNIRVMLIDTHGNIVSIVKKEFEKPYYSLNAGWAEQKPDFYWENMCEVCKKLRAQNEELFGSIKAVTFTAIRDTCLCLDKNGNPLRDIILWLDKRESSGRKKIPVYKRLIYRLVNMTDTINLQMKVSACNWIAENEPEIWEKTDKYVMLTAYITKKITGRLVDSVANMIGHIPFDSKTHTWMKKSDIRRTVFDIPMSKHCELVEPGELIGHVCDDAAIQSGMPKGLPLYATGSDKGCETLGMSCTSPEKAAISLGTTATIQLTTENYMEPLPFIPAYPSVLAGHFNPEVQIYRGYWLISWFKREFAQKEVLQAKELGVSAEELLNKRLCEVPPGCDGLIFQPYFTPGVVMPKARGAIIGFSDVHTRVHIYRAIIEGISFAVLEGMRTMERRGEFKVEELYICGGGSQSDEICQITASIANLPVKRIQTFEAGGLGSAMVAFVSMGIFSDYDEAINEMVHVKDVFLPDSEDAKIYKFIYEEVFEHIFSALLPLYKKSYEKNRR